MKPPFLCCSMMMSYHNTAPDDYTSVNTSFIFVTGTLQGGPGSQMCVSIAVRNDTLVEFDESFQVIAGLITATVFIRDDESEHLIIELYTYNYSIVQFRYFFSLRICMAIATLAMHNVQHYIDGMAILL